MYRCTKCQCSFKITIDKSKLSDVIAGETFLEVLFLFGQSSCEQLNSPEKHQMNEINKPSKKIKLEKFAKYIKAVTNIEVTQELTNSILTESQKIKGLVHGSSISPYGYLLQADIQVIKTNLLNYLHLKILC